MNHSSKHLNYLFSVLLLVMLPSSLKAFSVLTQKRAVGRMHRVQSTFGLHPITYSSRSLSRFAAANNDDNNFEKEFAQKQKATSSDLTKDKKTTTSTSTESEHTTHQAEVFDEMASFFASDDAVPDEVVPILNDMASTMIQSAMQQRALTLKENQASRPARANANATYEDNHYHILDVGCGTGALFDSYLKAANAHGITVHIHGLDLAPKMVEKANEKAATLMSESGEHSIVATVGDIGNLDLKMEQQYDLVVANSCFANFWDPAQALRHMSQQLRLGGRLCITHPLGSQFVQQLHEQDASTVPHLLPTTMSKFQQMTRTLSLQDLEIVDKDSSSESSSSFYMASATKVSYHTLPQTMRLRGNVDTGYGRGGKKLGFPTANLPSRLFQGALEDVPCGVYFGWAVLEDNSGDGGDKKKGRNVPHKAVVNVGFSPTFEGKENSEKVVEAHLILNSDSSSDSDDKSSPLDPPDFYDEVMRLQLHGFIRPEMKFPSFPDLIAQITTDVADAKDALDLDLYTSFQKDSFLTVDNGGTTAKQCWVGQSGGDETASWDFEDVESVMEKL